VIVIGLDSVPPALAFELFAEQMPTLTRLRREGRWGPLRSTDPPITVPAWVTMTSGRDPGELGVYGFRDRRPGTYGMRLVGAGDLAHPRIWNLASEAGLRSVVVSVPLTYPPRAATSPGVTLTSCFLTPGPESTWVEPASLRDEIVRRFGPYIVDTDSHRGGDRRALVRECRALTRQHFALFRHLIESEDPAFAMLVDLGPDRFHHGLLSEIWPEHPRHVDGGELAGAGREYYALLDREIAETVELAGPETLVMVVSDHGVRPLLGGVCVNEWLRKEGYLVLEEEPAEPTPIPRCKVDWGRTRAWGEGGYHARVFFNVAGREPQGVVSPDELRTEREVLADRLESLPGPGGEPMDTRAIAPESRFRQLRGNPPDLMVYFDGLARRSVGSVGHGGVHVATNDTGPDDANHDLEGIYVACGAGVTGAPDPERARIADVFATAVDALGLRSPPDAGGRSMMVDGDVL
jgi:predicted AlkP superfamily phosphohydrolase/phosphomutase